MVKLVDHQIKKCFECGKAITIKYNYPQKRYSQQNDWYYWTENEENQDKYICNECLITLYNNNKRKYQKEMANSSKKKTMTSFIYKLRNK